MHSREGSREQRELCVVANFVEVWLAREGHDRPVGINYLEKIQIPHLPSIYGALLAGVDYILMGAGIPLKIPGAIDALAVHAPATYPLTITGSVPGDDTLVRFDPADIVGDWRPPLKRPAFLAIVGSSTLALTLLRKANGVVDGFIVEGPTAGGHNAPPRGKAAAQRGRRADLRRPRQGRPRGLPRVRRAVLAGRRLRHARPGCARPGPRVPRASRSAPPSRCATTPGCGRTIARHCSPSARGRHARADRSARVADGIPVQGRGRPWHDRAPDEVYAARPRICDLGYLREAYRRDDGTIGYRCAAEPVSLFVSQGRRRRRHRRTASASATR